jgi:SecD/SecF fusion protein
MKYPMLLAAFAVAICLRPASAETLKIVVDSAVVTPDLWTMTSMLTLKLKADGKVAILDFTRARVGEHIKLRVGDQVLSEPIVNEPISEGVFVISGGFTDEQAHKLVTTITDANGIIEVDGSDK